MKFLYSDTHDYVDPHYDFLTDSSPRERERYWSDRYAHEMMAPPPYDGLLIAMSAVRKADGVASSKVRYTTAEEQRLLRVGARNFLRFDSPKCRDLVLMGDCGAFAYAEQPTPPFNPDEVMEFYLDAEFTHGISPDHLIFDCHLDNPPRSAMASSTVDRFDITIENARQFLKLNRKERESFEPVGAIQGWSPKSIAEAAAALVKMGYRYLAVGGLVPLKAAAIAKVLQAIRSKIGDDPKLHLLGFAKAEVISEFSQFKIESFDSTSPLIRAFKDGKSNYYLPDGNGGLDYYTAIRIPQALENSRLMQGVKRGALDPDKLIEKERNALRALRDYDKGRCSVDVTLELVMDYSQLLFEDDYGLGKSSSAVENMTHRVRRTLVERPWQQCDCEICAGVGVEVIIFRGSNRNKRRGFHNLGVFHRHVVMTIGNT